MNDSVLHCFVTSVYRLFFVSPSFGKLTDGGFDVAVQLLRQTVHLHLFCFLGGVRVG